MSSNKVKFWNSVVSRFSLLFITLIVFAILISGFLVFSESSKVITEFSKDRIRHTSNLTSQAFYSLLQEAANDIALLSSNTTIHDFVENPAPENLQRVNELFKATLENKPAYFQARLINADDEGLEIARVDKGNNRVFGRPKARLQDKGDKDYVQETRTLKKGEYFYSAINLNEEYGTVSVPLTPTLRTASPVFDKNEELKYVLVININLGQFYERLNSIMESGVKLLIIDAQDRYLFAPNMNKCFGDQLGTDDYFYKDFDRGKSELIDGISTMKEIGGAIVLYYVEPLTYYQDKQKIYLVTVLEEDIAFKSAFKVRNKSIMITLIVCVVALIIALAFTRFFSSKIKQVTQAIDGYDEKEKVSHLLPLDGKDEIGVLARTFYSMRQRIDQQMQDLTVSLEKEQKAIRERDEFLQNMSHELRTPLNAILGLTSLLEKNNPQQEQKPIIQSLDRSANNLAGLMYDILDHQQLIEGKIQLKYKPSNIHELLNDIHASYQFEAINKGLKFEFNADDHLKGNLYQTDSLRLTQIVTNLVVNAIRYTNSGSILLKGSIQNTLLEISIADTGIGIAGDNLKKLQDRFYQVKSDSSHRGEGFGLGLSIVTHLVGLFGGQLLVESELNEGSVFKIQLPIQAAQQGATSTNGKETFSYPSLFKPARVLHIEDDESAMLLIKSSLESEQVEVIQKSNWSDAQNQLEKEKFDLIITDVMLDKRSIKEDLIAYGNVNTELPMIVISALEPEKLKEISPYFFQKPFALNELIDRTYALLGAHEFDVPQLDQIYDMYDRQPDKINNYLKILIEEFQQYLERIESVYESKDQKEWLAIKHKIITHIKGLQLDRLSQHLPESIMDLTDNQFMGIQNLLEYLLCFFRTERSANSAN